MANRTFFRRPFSSGFDTFSGPAGSQRADCGRCAATVSGWPHGADANVIHTLKRMANTEVLTES